MGEAMAAGVRQRHNPLERLLKIDIPGIDHSFCS